MTELAPGFRCPLCGGERATVELVLHDLLTGSTDAPFPLARCASCRLLRLHPQPDDATLTAAYPSDYAPFHRERVSGWAKSWLERRSVRQLSRYFAPPRRVLDVGCSTGELLLAVRAQGNANVTGVEAAAGAAAVARSRGLDVRLGAIEDAAFDAAAFDTVVVSHTLEHVRDPVATLREINRVLAPGGAVILWLPNVDSLEARALGLRWIGYDAPRHLTTFSVATLTRALVESGAVVAQVRHEVIGLEWAWAVRLALRTRAPRVERALARVHALLIVAATPLAALGAAVRRSGRIRVVAVKPVASRAQCPAPPFGG